MKQQIPWPNLYIVGAAKSGTTSLHYYLSQHPEIFMSAVKEPHFFSQIDPDPRFSALAGCEIIRDEQSYLRLFESAKTEIIRGEASPSYLWDQDTPERIAAVSPDAKIIIMLREPVKRAYSHYLNDVRAGIEKRSFLEAIAIEKQESAKAWGKSALYVDLGFYSEQIARYQALFENVFVIFFEDFIQDIKGHLRQICDFLAVDSAYIEQIEIEAINTYVKPRGKISQILFGNPQLRILSRMLTPSNLRPFFKKFVFVKDKKPSIDPQAAQLLQEIYQDEILKLQKLLQQDTPWQTFS